MFPPAGEGSMVPAGWSESNSPREGLRGGYTALKAGTPHLRGERSGGACTNLRSRTESIEGLVVFTEDLAGEGSRRKTLEPFAVLIEHRA